MMKERTLKMLDDVFCETGNETVLISRSGNDEVIVLGEIETFIWKNMFDHTYDELIELINSEYEIDETVKVRDDVTAFIDALIEKEIIQTAGGEDNGTEKY